MQAAAGSAVLAAGGLMAWGALEIPAEAGYSGVGPNFLPWIVALGLAGCGLLLVLRAAQGGWHDVDEPTGDEHGHWSALAWVAGGIVVNAALITSIGFIGSCALCFALAVRGLRLSEGKARSGAEGIGQAARDMLVGAAIAAPVFWVFTKLLNISLPGLTGTGWL